MIPAGSLTADHEIVNGTWTFAPLAGARGVGAGGAAIASMPITTMHRIVAVTRGNAVRYFILDLQLLIERYP
jgi:hypothetical protein